MTTLEPFYIQSGNIYAVPVIHYTLETAAEVCRAFHFIKPDCVAVELAETMQLQLLHAASRLPDVSVVCAETAPQDALYYMCEPCEPAFEGLRCALENRVSAYCIDLDVEGYPLTKELIPDPYAIQRIGLEKYYEIYLKSLAEQAIIPSQKDVERELHMARRLKELSLSYDKVLFVGGMYHIQRVLEQTKKSSFPPSKHADRNVITLATLTESSCRDVLGEFGWMSVNYEMAREEFLSKKREELLPFPPERQKVILQLYKQAAGKYVESTGNPFPGYNLRNTMKFARNYALSTGRLLPDLYQILSSAKGCVDSNYAYETWALATNYPYLKNVDGLPELNLSIEDVWGHSKLLRFHLKQKSPKSFLQRSERKDRSRARFKPPGPFTLCSYPPEDLIIEDFGKFLKKKGTQLLTEEAARTAPFSSSIEDGIDTKETIRHWPEKKLYVKVRGKPPGGVGSVVVIFDEDKGEEGEKYEEKFPWKATWLGEHSQESDMALYATSLQAKVVGPGISRCEYGGFMMSYPPRRLFDIWNDPDYFVCRSKAELLLMAAIDYAVKTIVVYVGAKPPRSHFKSYASRFGKKIVYIPIGQLSPVTLNKLRAFHVLDGQDKRGIAGEYIY